MIFADTGAIFALFVQSDVNSSKARLWLRKNREPLVTTDYIVDELLTLFRRRGEGDRGLRAGKVLLAGSLARWEWVKAGDVLGAWEIYQRFHDKEWSFTDCVSLAVMERLGVKKAFSFDHHFRQFGKVTTLP